MQRIVLGLLAAGLLFFGLRGLVRLLASDETKIGWLVEDSIEGFNATRPKACLRTLAVDWTHEQTGVDRDLMHKLLVKVFFEAKDPESKKFLFVAELEEDQLAIEVDDAGRTATVAGEIQFHLRSGEELEPVWRVRVEGDLEKDPDDGWLFVRTRHENLAGTRLHRSI